MIWDRLRELADAEITNLSLFVILMIYGLLTVPSKEEK